MLPRLLALAVLFAVFGCSEPAETTQVQGVLNASALQQETVMPAGTDLELPPRDYSEPRPSPNAETRLTIGTTNVIITYGRPGVKGRTVFGELEPWGEVWRAGANEATVFAVDGDVTINGQPLEAGVYALFMTPNESGAWTVHFNSVANQWGAFRRDAAEDVLVVNAEPMTAPSMEWLSYTLTPTSMTAAEASLHWSTTKVPFTVAVAS
ncbi:MAG: DUF2911 domain-containing protein [Bacteroidota bacterium]